MNTSNMNISAGDYKEPFAKSQPQQRIEIPTYDETRNMVNSWLGGEFDYNEFEKDVTSLLDSANDQYWKFKLGKLVVPEPDPEIKELLEKVWKMKF